MPMQITIGHKAADYGETSGNRLTVLPVKVPLATDDIGTIPPQISKNIFDVLQNEFYA